VTTEALGPGSVLVSKERRESLGEEECLDWASAPKEKASGDSWMPSISTVSQHYQSLKRTIDNLLPSVIFAEIMNYKFILPFTQFFTPWPVSFLSRIFLLTSPKIACHQLCWHSGEL